MKLLKRILCLSLCVLMLLPCLVACRGGEEEPVESASETEAPADVASETVSEEPTESQRVFQTDENGYVKDELPDTTYGGKEINIVGWKGNEAWTLPKDSGDGNVQIYSKIYYHKMAVEARLDVQFKVNYITSHGNGGMQPDIVQELTTLVSAGTDAYDLVQGYSLYPAVLAREGLLYNINNLQYPDLEMPWWPEEITNWQQYGGLYFVANNSSAIGLRSMFVMFSNTEMITGAGLTDPVDLVLDGSWTIDKMMEYAKAFHGDAVAKPGEAYGFVVDDFSRMDAFYYGAGFKTTVNNADGSTSMTWSDASYRERVETYLEPLVEFFKLPEVEIAQNTVALMKDKKTALMSASMSSTSSLTDNTYAVIPIPKLDEESDYYTMRNNGYDMWCIPKTSTQPELAGIVLEAISSSEYRNIAPFYFETVLKDRYSQSAKGAQVFDVIRASVTYDFGRVCQYAFTKGTIEGIWRGNFQTNRLKDPKNILESSWASKGENMEIELMEIQADFRNNTRAD